MINETWFHPEDNEVKVEFDLSLGQWVVMVLCEMIDYSYKWVEWHSFNRRDDAVAWASNPQNVA